MIQYRRCTCVLQKLDYCNLLTNSAELHTSECLPGGSQLTCLVYLHVATKVRHILAYDSCLAGRWQPIMSPE